MTPSSMMPHRTQTVDPTAPPPSAAGPPPRGRVLRVKTGYNPNSSSVGTDIPTFLAAAAGAAALTATALSLLSTTASRIRREPPTPDPETPDASEGPQQSAS